MNDYRNAFNINTFIYLYKPPYTWTAMTTTQVKVEATNQRPVEPTRASSVGEVEAAGGLFTERTWRYVKVTKTDHEAYHDAGVPHVHMGGKGLVVMLG